MRTNRETMKYFPYIALVTVGVTLALSAGIFAIAYQTLEQHLDTVETSTMTEDCAFVRAALQTDLNDVTMLCRDYATREETLSLLQNPENTTPETFEKAFMTAHQDTVMIYDSGGNLVYGEAIERSNQTLLPVPIALQAYLKDHDIGAEVVSSGHDSTGFLSLPEGPMMMSVVPIRTEMGDRPTQGALLFGRYIGEEAMYPIKNFTGLSVSFYSDDNPAAFAGTPDSDRRVQSVYPDIVPSADGSTLSGIFSLPDPDNKSALFTRVDRPRDLYFSTLNNITLLLLLVVVACASFSFIPLALDWRSFSRFETINSTVAAIRKDHDLSRRLPSGKIREVNVLTTSINSLLSLLEKSTVENHRYEERLQDSKERYGQLFNVTSDAVFIIQNGYISECNTKAQELLGRGLDEVKMHIFPEFSPEYQPDGRRSADVLHEYSVGVRENTELCFEWRCLRKDGSPVDIEIALNRFSLKSGSYLLAVCKDPSAKKETERIRSEACTRIEKNLEQFAGLNDEIRNPLQVILAIAEMSSSADAALLLDQVKQIDRLVDGLDHGYIASEKVREFLKKHDNFEK